MAEAILRLKVESTEYEQKLKRASQSLLQMAENAKRTGAALSLADKEEVAFVRSLGQLQTTATTTRGRVTELTNAFTDLSVHYHELDEETRSSDYGKGLKSSLEAIKSRVKILQSELQDVNNDLKVVNTEMDNSKNAGGVFIEVLEGISGKLGVNIGSMSKLGVAVGAAGAALKVAKDAFMNSELNIDAWARVVESAKGSYSLFLDTINGGNWTNFFSNLKKAIADSRDLADAFDRMERVETNNSAAIASQRLKIQQLRSRKAKGEDVDDELQVAVDKLYTMQLEEVDAAKKAALKKIENELKNRVNSIAWSDKFDFKPLIESFLNQLLTDGQYAYDNMAALNNSLKQKQSKTINSGTFDERTVLDRTALNTLETMQYIFSSAVIEGETSIAAGLRIFAEAIQKESTITKEEVKGIGYALSDTKTFADKAAKSIKDTFPIGSLGAYEQELSRLNAEQKKVTSTEDWINLQEQIDDVNTSIYFLKNGLTEISKLELPAIKPLKMVGVSTDPSTAPTRIIGKAESMSSSLIVPIPTPDNSDGITKENLKELANGAEKLLSGLNQIGVTLPAGFDRTINSINGLIQVIQGVQTIIGVLNTIIAANTTAQTLNTAAQTANAATTSANAGVDIAQMAIKLMMAGFANGGIVHAANGLVVPGSSYSGDKVPALLNSGELVLNRAQQGNLAAQLSNGENTQKTTSTISGEQIFIVLNNYLRRSGIGELITSR